MSSASQMGLESEMASSSEELLLNASDASGRAATRRRGFAFVVGVLTMCAAVSVWHSPAALGKVSPGFLVGLSDEDADVPAVSTMCKDELPFIMIDKVISSNLGKKGPDDEEEEGIIYKVKTHNLGRTWAEKNLQVHVHAVSSFDSDTDNSSGVDYEPAFKTGSYVNGVHGDFACINIKQNTSLKLRSHVYDVDAGEDVEVPHAVMSFFDIDAGKQGNHSVEHVTVGGYSAFYLSNETEIQQAHKDGFVTFTATKEGTGDDNPKDPMVLSPLQKNKAVTIEFKDVKHFDFEVGATAGYTARVFTWVWRPSLMCAPTEISKHLFPATGRGAPIVPVKESGSFKGLPSVTLMFGVVLLLVQSFM